MLVYCNTLWLQSSTDTDRVFYEIARWLGQKTGQFVDPQTLKRRDKRHFSDGSTVETDYFIANAVALYVVSLVHRDREVSGRRWITQIGLRQRTINDEVECSVLMETEEISARVTAPIQVTRPRIVTQVAQHCAPAPRTPGLTIKTLDDGSVHALDAVIHSDQRDYPIVLISPKKDTGFIIDRQRILSLLVGLAEIVEITPAANTFYLSEVLGKRYSAWNGAVNIIFPRSRRDEDRQPHNHLLLSDHLENLRADNVILEDEILSVVTHRTNLPHSWRHISFATIREARFQFERNERLAAAKQAGDNAEYTALLESENADNETKVAQLVATNREYEQLLQLADEEIEFLQSRNSQSETDYLSLKDHLAQLNAQRRVIAGGQTQLQALRTPLVQLLSGITDHHEFVDAPLLTNTLQVIAALFPERVEILDTAWESAEESRIFQFRTRAFELLWKLTTAYWEALVQGGGDAEARAIFGNAYASSDSETVEHNKRARDLRTFSYRHKPLVMMSHLKIGRKDSLAETLRIHFTWISEEQKIVIGHCGRHLDEH